MPAMKNVYNLITDAFRRIRRDETKYTIDVQITEGFNYRNYNITIKDPSITGLATLTLVTDLHDYLLEYGDTNDLFLNETWDSFCYTFESQVTDESF